MHLFKIEREWSYKNNFFPLIFLGDFHVGNTNCDYKLLSEHIKEISEMPNAMVFIMGDMAEWIVPPKDKRWTPTNIDRMFWDDMERLPMAYLDYLEELLTPIAHQIEVIHNGNHERTMKFTMNPCAELCGRLRKIVAEDYGPEIAMNRLRFAPGEAYTKITWKMRSNSDYRSTIVNTAHGWQAGRTEGPKHNAMNTCFEWIGADLVFRGHSHELFCDHGPVREAPNPQMTKIVESTTLYGHTGSYLKTRKVVEDPDEISSACYSEEKGYRPLTRGHVQVHVTLKGEGLSKTGITKE